MYWLSQQTFMLLTASLKIPFKEKKNNQDTTSSAGDDCDVMYQPQTISYEDTDRYQSTEPFTKLSQPGQQQINWNRIKVSRDIKDAVHGTVQQLKDFNNIEWDYTLSFKEGRNPEINQKIISLVKNAFPNSKEDVIKRACRSYFVTRKTRATRLENNKLDETRKKQRKRQRQTNLRLRRLAALKRLQDISKSDKEKLQESLSSTLLISSEESDDGDSDQDKRLIVRRLRWRSDFLNHWYSVLDSMTQKGFGFLPRIESPFPSNRPVPDDLPLWVSSEAYL